MPLRAPKIYGFIFGFQRLVWCPKWTPASSNCFIEISPTLFSFSFDLPFRHFHHRTVDGTAMGDRKGCEMLLVSRGLLSGYSHVATPESKKSVKGCDILAFLTEFGGRRKIVGKTGKLTGSWTRETLCSSWFHAFCQARIP